MENEKQEEKWHLKQHDSNSRVDEPNGSSTNKDGAGVVGNRIPDTIPDAIPDVIPYDIPESIPSRWSRSAQLDLQSSARGQM